MTGLTLAGHARGQERPAQFMADYNTSADRGAKVTPFTAWLAEAMRSRSVTAKQLAGRSGLSQSMVSMLISGDREPTRENIPKIARGLVPEEDDAQREAIEKAARLAAGFTPDPDDSGDALILEREYQTPRGDNFKIYGLGDVAPDVLEKIAGDVDRRMREWDTEERLKRYESQGHESGAGNGEETRRS